MILYSLISVKLPFEGETDDEIMEKVVNQELSFDGPIWQDVSSELKDLIRGML